MPMKGGRPWHEVADVVVVGYGCAGAVASATAREAGAEVLLLEKQPAQSHHTNSSMSAGLVVSLLDREQALEYVEALYRVEEDLSWTEKEVLRAWAEYAADNTAWIEANGGRVQRVPGAGEHPQVPGCEALGRYHFAGRGRELAGFLSNLVKARGIPVRFNTEARRLLTDSRGRVVGVEVIDRSGEEPRIIKIGASRGVVLTCGGFEFNEAMKLNYLKIYPTYFSGSEANTGDGIRMALEVGADLWHMNCASARLMAKSPEYPWAMGVDLWGGGTPVPQPGSALPCGYVIVDRSGRRYTNENFKSHIVYYELALYDSHRLGYPRIPSYWILDRRRMEAGPLCNPWFGPTGPSRLYEWSRDNSRELEKGWIVSASTTRELARRLEMHPDVLEATVNTYNRYCQQGQDADFARAHLFPLDQPPFSSVKLWPGGFNTQGGPRRNARAQVLRGDGQPIPGLYSAGELGSIYGMLYPGGGCNLAECIAFGRLAGENAASEHRG